MLRLSLLTPAPTTAHYQARFAADEEGIEPLAERAIERLVGALGRRIDAVWHGPERRNAETVAGLGLTGHSSTDLRAWSVGEWQGQSIEQLAARDAVGLAAWRRDPHAAPPGGESLTELLQRVGHWTDSLRGTDARWVVIADAAVLRAIIVHVLQAPPATFWRIDLAPLSLALVQHAGDEWRLRQLGPVNAAD
jgi:broad specificity phosphatase PhoE